MKTYSKNFFYLCVLYSKQVLEYKEGMKTGKTDNGVLNRLYSGLITTFVFTKDFVFSKMMHVFDNIKDLPVGRKKSVILQNYNAVQYDFSSE